MQKYYKYYYIDISIIIKEVSTMWVLDEVKERLSIFRNLYDAMRIVDPINKKVVTMENEAIVHLGEACYEVWNRNKFCENCTSMRAYIQNDTCVKIECKDRSIMLTIATPIEYWGEVYILEMLKDISKNTINNQVINENIEGINFLLKEIGNKILKDELTGIYNRRYMSERLPVDINKCALEKNPLSIIMVDIDFFKDVNDTYGHVIGDKVLKDFASFIIENIDHDTSWTARYGGEEFIIVLNNIDIQAAFETAERIRKRLEKKVFIYGEIQINITSSFGVYCVDGRKVEINDLINEADKNLYKAKHSGRNITIK